MASWLDDSKNREKIFLVCSVEESVSVSTLFVPRQHRNRSVITRVCIEISDKHLYHGRFFSRGCCVIIVSMTIAEPVTRFGGVVDMREDAAVCPRSVLVRNWNGVGEFFVDPFLLRLISWAELRGWLRMLYLALTVRQGLVGGDYFQDPSRVWVFREIKSEKSYAVVNAITISINPCKDFYTPFL